MIGLIGGTFDPIHFGHLRPALEIMEQLSLDQVRFIPSANPPHRWKPQASAEQRLEMVKLALDGVKKFEIDDREYHRDGPSYTVDTLISIRKDVDKKTSLCMILGMDAFEHFTKWKNWQEILELVHLVISSRPGYENIQKEDWMGQRVTKNIADLNNSPAGRIFFAESNQFDISATYLRKQISSGKSAQYLTPKSVNKYILKKKLYGTFYEGK